jgi:hypothetical protein
MKFKVTITARRRDMFGPLPSLVFEHNLLATDEESAEDWANHEATEYEYGYDKHIEFCTYSVAKIEPAPA